MVFLISNSNFSAIVLLFLSSLLVFLQDVVSTTPVEWYNNKYNNNKYKQRQNQYRKLAQSPILSYQPKTQVTDQAAIDLDVQEIVEDILLSSGDIEGTNMLQSALDLYVLGGHSGSYAVVYLDEILMQRINAGTQVMGIATSGREVFGIVMEDAAVSSSVLHIRYATSDIPTKHVGCQVGGSSRPVLDGCLNESGSLTVMVDDDGNNNIVLSYAYLPDQDNRSDRTIQMLSTKLQERMPGCISEGGGGDVCSNAVFQKFYNYYGVSDYGDVLIRSAFNQEINFITGNVDFSNVGNENTLLEAVETAMIYINIWMYTIYKLQVAVDNCENDSSMNDASIGHWDEAVAYYTGSQQTSNGSGYLLYSIAQHWCNVFGTCIKQSISTKQTQEEQSENSDQKTAYVNYQIFQKFIDGQSLLMQGKCAQLNTAKERIVQLMTVPLVQATLSLAYDIDIKKSPVDLRGTVVASSILPLIDACNSADADILYQNMMHQITEDNNTTISSKPATSYANIKAALERNYACLGISCDEVGGIVDSGSTSSFVYLQHAQPCRCNFVDGICYPTTGESSDQSQVPPTEPPPSQPQENQPETGNDSSTTTQEDTPAAEPDGSDAEDPAEEDTSTSSSNSGWITTSFISIFLFVVLGMLG